MARSLKKRRDLLDLDDGIGGGDGLDGCLKAKNELGEDGTWNAATFASIVHEKDATVATAAKQTRNGRLGEGIIFGEIDGAYLRILVIFWEYVEVGDYWYCTTSVASSTKTGVIFFLNSV